MGMTSTAVKRLFACGLMVQVFACFGAVATAQNGHQSVNCANDQVGTVQRTLAEDCVGRVVTDEEAAEIRQQRRDYVRNALSRSELPGVAGKRLSGLGSGFFVANDGAAVTSNHVVKDCAAITVTPTFGEMRTATIVATDPETDLALIRSDAIPPGIAGIVPGERPAVIGAAYVIGYPNRGLVTIEPVLTAVDVVAREGKTPVGPAIVLRGDIRQGNSGGPLLDSAGRVLGVVFAKVNSVNVYNATGQVVRNIGFALPGDTLEAFLAIHDVDYEVTQTSSPQPEDRILEYARPFLAQVGCWN